jgi:hypothetical protein
MFYTRLFFIFLAVQTVAHAGPQKAVCVVPVADLLGDSAQKGNSAQLQKSYFSLPLAPKKINEPARVHQLLFNEVVMIKEIRGHEALIEIPHLFYETTNLKQPQTHYWTLVSNLKTFDQLAQHGINPTSFPLPLTRNKERFEKALHNTASLTRPFFDVATNKTYSAGTRFVVAEKTDTHLAVHAFDLKQKGLMRVSIPKNICFMHEEKDHHERVRDFVAIVTSWAHDQSGFIPYVWGGCSIGQLCSKDHFIEEDGGFYRNELPNHLPLAGLDCTGLVARAAHLAGIPYFYKNSFTLAKYLAPLQHNDAVADGDLIWIPGHVMVVSSVAKAKLVEARHYSHGYGKVHEISLAQQFQGIDSYEKLAKTFFSKRSLKRLDKSGKVVQVIPEFKILKLASVWH